MVLNLVPLLWVQHRMMLERAAEAGHMRQVHRMYRGIWVPMTLLVMVLDMDEVGCLLAEYQSAVLLWVDQPKGSLEKEPLACALLHPPAWVEKHQYVSS